MPVPRSSAANRGSRRSVVAHVAPAALLVLSSSCAFAQKAEKLEEINVVANAVATPNDQTGNSVTVVTAEQIQQMQRRTAPEILQALPGLNVVQTGGAGATTSVMIRGTNQNHVKVLIDGIDVTDPSSANATFDFGQLLASDIERVEVLRGPQSGLYGSDAIGGVISITTKKGEGPPKVVAMTEGGTYGTLNQAIGVSGSQERVNYSFNLSRYGVGSQPVTPTDLVPPWGRVNNNSYNNVTASTKIGAQLNDVFGVNLVGRYTDSSLHYTSDDFSVFMPYGPSYGRPADIQSHQRDKQDYERAEITAKFFDGRFQNWFGVSRMHADTWVKPGDWAPTNNFGFVSSGYQPPSQFVGDRTKVDWRGQFEFMTGQKLIAGLESQRDSMNIPMLDPSQTAVQAGYTNQAGYLEYVGGFRDLAFLNANVRHDSSSQYGGHNTFRIAPSIHIPWTQTVLKASYGTGFKAPTLNQLYVSYPSGLPSFNFFANPTLKPEQSRGFDLGFEQPVWNDRARFGATYFRNYLKNLIQVTAPDANFNTTLQNLASAETHGFEAFAQARVTDELTLRADYTYTIARNATAVSPDPASIQTELLREIAEGTSQPDLLRRPKRKASLQAIWKPTEKLTLSATLVRTSSWIDISRDGYFPRVIAPGFTTLNVAGSYDLAKGVTATARVDNIGNKQYENPVGYRTPGLVAIAGLRMSY
ncbi:MAG: TonB-dependent receptor [Hyphomicrobiales bacterium]|nr:TonB-dependent receptor [Hyphomicrobiales bacterium]